MKPEHVHRWSLPPEGPGGAIPQRSQGRCRCGAVRDFPTVLDYDPARVWRGIEKAKRAAERAEA